MANQQEAFSAVATRFITEWGSTTSVIVDNSTATDEAGEPDDYGSDPYAELIFSETTSNQKTLGPTGKRKYRRDCICNVVIRTPKGSGTEDANNFAIQARGILEGVRINNDVIINDVEIIRVGINGKWYALSVLAEFFYIETK